MNDTGLLSNSESQEISIRTLPWDHACYSSLIYEEHQIPLSATLNAHLKGSLNTQRKQQRMTASSYPNYSNSVATTKLLLQDGDIEKNSGAEVSTLKTRNDSHPRKHSSTGCVKCQQCCPKQPQTPPSQSL